MSDVRSTVPAGETHWWGHGKGNSRVALPRVQSELEAATHLSGRTPRVVCVGEFASAGGASSHPAAPNRRAFLPSYTPSPSAQRARLGSTDGFGHTGDTSDVVGHHRKSYEGRTALAPSARERLCVPRCAAQFTTNAAAS
jgi:hypothetical protein